jgi:hypothetical protein
VGGAASIFEVPPPAELSSEEGEAQERCVAMAPGIDWRAPTRFPKAVFASTVSDPDKDVPNGLSRHAHWVLGLRWHNVAYANRRVAPRSIFVQIQGLGSFMRHILPCLTHRFVLMIGDEDMTAPRQVWRLV